EAAAAIITVIPNVVDVKESELVNNRMEQIWSATMNSVSSQIASKRKQVMQQTISLVSEHLRLKIRVKQTQFEEECVSLCTICDSIREHMNDESKLSDNLNEWITQLDKLTLSPIVVDNECSAIIKMVQTQFKALELMLADPSAYPAHCTVSQVD